MTEFSPPDYLGFPRGSLSHVIDVAGGQLGLAAGLDADDRAWLYLLDSGESIGSFGAGGFRFLPIRFDQPDPQVLVVAGRLLPGEPVASVAVEIGAQRRESVVRRDLWVCGPFTLRRVDEKARVRWLTLSQTAHRYEVTPPIDPDALRKTYKPRVAEHWHRHQRGPGS